MLSAFRLILLASTLTLTPPPHAVCIRDVSVDIVLKYFNALLPPMNPNYQVIIEEVYDLGQNYCLLSLVSFETRSTNGHRP